MDRLAPLVPLLVFLGACEDQGNKDNDNLLTGLSGLVIVLVAVAIVVHYARKKRRQ
jgi:hypothetical protein